MDDYDGLGQSEDAKHDDNLEDYNEFHLELETQYLGDQNDNYVGENDDDVYVILAQKEKDLLLAAELGKALLEKNEELTQKYERLQEEYAQNAEELEQEKHELRLKIERIGRSHESRVHELQTDIQSLQSELRSIKSASLTDSASKRKTFAGLTEENEKLNSELSQLKDENHSLKEELSNLKRPRLSKGFSIDDIQNQHIEFEKVCKKLTRIEEERNFLRQNVEELLSNKEILTKDIEELQEKNEELQKSYKDINNQLNDTEDKLNESKTDNLYLQDQLEEMKIQASLDQTSRGSLFSELSDMAVTSDDVIDGEPKLTSGKNKQNGHSSITSNTMSQGVTSTPATASLSCNKRPRQYASVDSEEEVSDDSDLEYDEIESDVEIDGFVARNVEFYAQLEEQRKRNSELKMEIVCAHNELRVCYDKLRLANDNRASKVEALDPEEEFDSGCLTSFVQSFKDVVDDMIKVQKKNSVSRKNSGYAGSMVGSYSDNLLDQIRQLKEDLYEAYRDMEHWKEKNATNKSKLNKKETEIASLTDKLKVKTEEVNQLHEERKRLVLKECDPNLAFNSVFKQALKDKEDALRRECELAIELEKTKRDANRLDRQLMEAIQQKIELSEQLEEWQYDMASLIDEQVQKQMRSAATEKGEVRARKSLFSKGWNWSPGSKRQNII